MEFSFDVKDIFTSGISIWTARDVSRLDREAKSKVEKVIDVMGIASSKAQGYSVITSSKKFQDSKHKIYLLVSCEKSDSCGKNNVVIGLLKVGEVKLFIFDAVGKVNEIEPLCVLDFYVHESQQRSGMGKMLFDFMLKVWMNFFIWK